MWMCEQNTLAYGFKIFENKFNNLLSLMNFLNGYLYCYKFFKYSIKFF